MKYLEEFTRSKAQSMTKNDFRDVQIVMPFSNLGNMRKLHTV